MESVVSTFHKIGWGYNLRKVKKEEKTSSSRNNDASSVEEEVEKEEEEEKVSRWRWVVLIVSMRLWDELFTNF